MVRPSEDDRSFIKPSFDSLKANEIILASSMLGSIGQELCKYH